ncbi:protein NRT1/ PTR FAMILY 5.11 isoform X2 [Spinacia oleracea]|uniref:Protein NRT1/ PTR FAMILY 5.11 isoform X2 n=1 Tax=Spinacia oleracea TaxID=3562 RepID=A0ABM3QHU3_SPIOL|nr:protein NRT1/ PTR FAMILY 5.11-like isoform X2 [Spinacia oleracea]
MVLSKVPQNELLTTDTKDVEATEPEVELTTEMPRDRRSKFVRRLSKGFAFGGQTISFKSKPYEKDDLTGLAMWYLALSHFKMPLYKWGFFIMGLLLITIGQSGYESCEYSTEPEDLEKGGSNHQEQESKRQHGKGACVSFSKRALKSLLRLLIRHRSGIMAFVFVNAALNVLSFSCITLSFMMFGVSVIVLTIMTRPKKHVLAEEFGWLDKAAALTSYNVTVEQVEDTKCFIRSSCLSLVFLTYGVMTAVGDTFFIDQADEMKKQIGSFEVPIQLFVLILEAIKQVVSWITEKVNAPHNNKRFYGALRLGLGMLLSVPCFLIASVIETKILEAKRLHHRQMSVLWLTPQLLLWGIMDGLAVDGIEDFFKHEMPESVAKSYGNILAEAVVGAGKILSVGWFCLCYYAGIMIEGKPGWIGKDMQGSHLEYYYAVTALFGLVSFFLYVWVAFKQDSQVLPPPPPPPPPPPSSPHQHYSLSPLVTSVLHVRKTLSRRHLSQQINPTNTSPSVLQRTLTSCSV